MEKKKLFQIGFKTVFDKKSDIEGWPQVTAFSWDIVRNKYAYVVANDMESALKYVHNHFAALTSKLTFAENERPVDIESISVYKDDVYA